MPGRLDALVEDVVHRVWPALERADGFAGGELYRADSDTDPRLVAITRWRDEAALAAFVGPAWRSAPTVLPRDERLVARPPHAWQFTPVPTPLARG